MRQIVVAHYHILRGAYHRRTVGRREDITGGHHQDMRFGLCLHAQRQMNSHLVAVKVCVETSARQRMQHNGITFNEHRLKCLHTHSVKRRSAVKQDGMLMNDFLENVPNLLVTPFDHSLGAFDGVGKSVLFELANDKRLVQLERYFLRQAALMELEVGAYHDYRPSRVIDALSEKILAESALFALDHIS